MKFVTIITTKHLNIGCDKTTGVGTTKFLDLRTVTETGKHILHMSYLKQVHYDLL
jgi:hypothetical protein